MKDVKKVFPDFYIEYPEEITRNMSFHAYVKSFPVAYAHISSDDNDIRLLDIYVYDYTKRASLLTRLLNFRRFRNYRSFGIGSVLLKEVIQFSRQLDATRIYGEARGDIVRLRKWYKSYGFSIDDEDNIELILTPGDSVENL